MELPGGLQPGLVWLEVQRGCLLSSPNHLLLCPSRGLADELTTAAAAAGGGSLTLDVGLLMGAKFSADTAALGLLATR